MIYAAIFSWSGGRAPVAFDTDYPDKHLSLFAKDGRRNGAGSPSVVEPQRPHSPWQRLSEVLASRLAQYLLHLPKPAAHFVLRAFKAAGT